MISTAFLVLYLDITTIPAHARGIGLFSEPYPTANLRAVRQFVVLEGRGEDYEAGIEHLRLQLRMPQHQWIWGLLDERSRKSLA